MLTRRQLLIASTLGPWLPGVRARPLSRQKLLLDTDIGSDIDDAVALAYLLRQPACELLGITTVTGEASRRADLARVLVKSAGMDIPVLPGIEHPLRIEQRQTTAPQAERLTGPPGQHPDGQAITFLRDTIRNNPGEIILLAVGPLTNVARLFQEDPEIPSLLKDLVIMGGKYSDYPTPWGPTEWNAIVDPDAARLVFDQATAITAYGLDITWQISMTPEEVSKRFRGDRLLEHVLDWSAVWFRERELLHFHDPLAAAAIFNPSLCAYQRGQVAVLMKDVPTQGITRFKADRRGNAKIATEVSPDAFFREYFSVFRQVESAGS